MSQQNLKLVSAVFAARKRADFDALTELYDPDVVFETLLLGTHHGHHAVRVHG
jgi:ketosteroid isomerase-like protein